MPNYMTNQLDFLSNSESILRYLKSKKNSDHGPEAFSLNSIRLMPESLNLPLNEHVMELSLLNIQPPPLDDLTEEIAFPSLFFGNKTKQSESSILDRVEKIRNLLKESNTDKESIKIFNQAVSNYNEFKYFSRYDWRLMNWGTDEDIYSIDTATFELPTKYIEFETAWMPPVSALQVLSNTFPSVKFKLRYRYKPTEEWVRVTFFPFPPFSY